jgi:hypothetical protein
MSWEKQGVKMINELPKVAPADDELMGINNASYVTVNYGQHFIKTTEDKVRLCLNEKIDELSSTIHNKESWATPLGIFSTIIVVFVTTEFRDWVLLSGTWNTIFIIAAIATFIWLFVTVCKALKSRKRTKSEIVNSIIMEISFTKKEVGVGRLSEGSTDNIDLDK